MMMRRHGVPTRSLAGLLLILLCCISPRPGINAAAQPREAVFDLRIENGRVPTAMRTIRVRQGDAVTLRFSSDRPIVVHLHGYDIEAKVAPGAVAEMAFAARATGRFPVEEHKQKQHGGHAHGEALLRIEVRPR
jgi:hypothetical protein